jgi:hypothetical protein
VSKAIRKRFQYFAGKAAEPAWLTLAVSRCGRGGSELFVQCTIACLPARSGNPVIVMLSLLVYLARRKRRFAWSPAVDLSDPYVAAALAPMTHS